MGEDFRDVDISRVIYLLLYLFLVIGGAEPPARTGLRGWSDNHPWAVGGAIWALIIWGLLFARHWWIGEPAPGWETLPLTVLGGLGVGWLLQRMHRRD
jgi:hypothetical protein